MVHWVYVLECEDDYLYVGETIHLFKRFHQHLRGAGSYNTSTHYPETLIGLYNIAQNESFRRYRNAVRINEYNPFLLDTWGEESYDHLAFENHITERFLYERKGNDCYGGGQEWYKVRGGKYTRSTMEETVRGFKWASECEGRIMHARNPTQVMPEEDIVDRPLCNCGNPSEVRLSKDKKTIYFVCALKNLWFDAFIGLSIPKPCNFWKAYTDDTAVKDTYRLAQEIARESWVQSIPVTRSTSPDPCFQCHKKNYLPVYSRGPKQICHSCLIDKCEELKGVYEACTIRL